MAKEKQYEGLEKLDPFSREYVARKLTRRALSRLLNAAESLEGELVTWRKDLRDEDRTDVKRFVDRVETVLERLVENMDAGK